MTEGVIADRMRGGERFAQIVGGWIFSLLGIGAGPREHSTQYEAG